MILHKTQLIIEWSVWKGHIKRDGTLVHEEWHDISFASTHWNVGNPSYFELTKTSHFTPSEQTMCVVLWIFYVNATISVLSVAIRLDNIIMIIIISVADWWYDLVQILDLALMGEMGDCAVYLVKHAHWLVLLCFVVAMLSGTSWLM